MLAVRKKVILIDFSNDESDYGSKESNGSRESDLEFDWALPDVEEDTLSASFGNQEKEVNSNTAGASRKKWSPKARILPNSVRPNSKQPKPRRKEIQPITDSINIPDFAPPRKNYDPTEGGYHAEAEPLPYYQEKKENELEEFANEGDYRINQLPELSYTNDEAEEMRIEESRQDQEEVLADLSFTQIDSDEEEDNNVLSILANINASNSSLSNLYEEEEDKEANFRVTDEEGDLLRNFDLDEMIALGIDLKASDLHITPDEKVAYTINGDIAWSDSFPIVPGEVTRILQQSIVSNVADSFFIQNWELDTSYVLKTGRHEGRRVRLNVSRKDDFAFMTMRIISDRIPTAEELGLEDALLKWTKLPNGLIMVNGPTNTGKALGLSTLLRKSDGNFTLMRDVKVGDKLISSNGRPCVVTGLSKVDLNPILFKIFLANGEDVLADSNHQWIVSSKNSRNLFAHADFEGLEEYNSIIIKAADRLKALSKRSFNDFNLAILIEVLREALPSYYFNESIISQFERFLDVDFCKDSEHALLSLANRFEAMLEYGNSSQFKVLTLAEMMMMGMEAEFQFPVVKNGVDIHDEYYSFSQLGILKIEEILASSLEYEPVKCITVDSDDSSYVLKNGLITHNSTTLAAMIQNMQNERSGKIITLEKPIEYEYKQNGRALVHQREIGRDALSFSSALDSAMRSAPNVILIGETRNQAEVDALLLAADTGHLAISTMHSISAPDTITRIKALFSGEEQKRVLSSLSVVSRGFANQVLLKSKNGGSRFAIREILEVDYDVASLIEIGDTRGIRKLQEERGITLEHNLVKAIIDGRATIDEAFSKTSHPLLFNKLLDEYYV